MYNVIIKTHVFSSIIFVFVALYVLYRNITGMLYQKDYTKKDKRLEILFIALLYSGLIFGIIMFFFLGPQYKPKMFDLDAALKYKSLRFWSVEHFSVMLVALMFSQIGKLFTSKSISSFQKFKYSTFYYGVATLFTFISTSIYLLNKG